MKKTLHWLDENLEEFILVIFLIAMTLIMGIQILCRYVLGMSLSWAEYSCFVTSEPIHICQYLETVFSYAFFIKIAILSSITPGIFIFRVQDQRRCGFISFFVNTQIWF